MSNVYKPNIALKLTMDKLSGLSNHNRLPLEAGTHEAEVNTGTQRPEEIGARIFDTKHAS